MGDAGGRGGAALTATGPAATDAPGAATARRPLSARLPALIQALFAVRPTRRPSWRAVAVGVGAVALGTAVGLLRQPGVGALDTMWAEDGQVFFSEAVRQGPLSALTTSYAGYYHAVPRLLAGVAALVPAEAASAVLAVEAALCTALVALLVYTASGAHLASTLSRLLVSVIVVVVPVAQDDTLNSIANLHWYGLYALFWVLIWAPAGRAGRFVAAAVVLLVSASDILSVVFLPLALLRALRRPDAERREPHAMLLAAALAVGLAVQFAGLLIGSSSRALAPDPLRAASGYLLRAVPAPLIGERWLGQEITARSLVLAALAWLVVAAAVLLAYARVVRPGWALALVAALHSAALYVLPVLLSGVATPRYAVAPAMLLVTALVALVQPRPAGAAVGAMRRSTTAPLYVLAALLAVVAAVNLRVDNRRADGPGWSAELERAAASCSEGATARVPVAPRGDRPWLVEIPCTHLPRRS
ncbi:hypothetical protein ABZ807_17045 [Micromonospora sp. NPDC047548]|uniref:hypothetical protein n=1 Tax=Micromonospora sp. NPDC047548 TaxID=3155624 RepID=UPI0033F7D7D3